MKKGVQIKCLYFQSQIIIIMRKSLLPESRCFSISGRLGADRVKSFPEENPHIKVGKVNVEEQRELAEKFHIMSIPALVLMKEGKAVASSVGVKPQAAIEKMLNS